MHLVFWKEVRQMPFPGKESAAYLKGKVQVFYSKFSHEESSENCGGAALPQKDSRSVSPLQTTDTSLPSWCTSMAFLKSSKTVQALTFGKFIC